jgi:hypothetical protein
MSVKHPSHPLCVCKGALWRTAAKNMKRVTDAYIYCRNERCESDARERTVAKLAEPRPETIQIPLLPQFEQPRATPLGPEGISKLVEPDPDSGSNTLRRETLDELRSCVERFHAKNSDKTREIWIVLELQQLGHESLAGDAINLFGLDGIELQRNDERRLEECLTDVSTD